MKNSNGVKETIHSTEEMKGFAEKFLSELVPQENSATVVGLYGDLGAGKTTFTKAVAEILGVADTVQSPTFVLMKRYEIRNTKNEIQKGDSKPFSLFRLSSFHFLIHIDAYRLEKSSELTNLGWKDLISDPKNLILIEWPERVIDVMPEHIKINFNHKSEHEREVEIN
jgi:tRNA threonylcarbamoyladenosine biosynthesis protein TsaE